MLHGSLSFTLVETSVNLCKVPLVSVSSREQSKLAHTSEKGVYWRLALHLSFSQCSRHVAGGLVQTCNGIKLLFTLRAAVRLWLSELALNELPEEPQSGSDKREISLQRMATCLAWPLPWLLHGSAPQYGHGRGPHSPQRAALSSTWICLGENSLNRADLESDSRSTQKPHSRFPE